MLPTTTEDHLGYWRRTIGGSVVEDEPASLYDDDAFNSRALFHP